MKAEQNEKFTLIGRLSTRRPFNDWKALLAPSAREKVTNAIPRLWPFGPHEISTFFTGPTDCWKYSCYRDGYEVSTDAGWCVKASRLEVEMRKSLRNIQLENHMITLRWSAADALSFERSRGLNSSDEICKPQGRSIVSSFYQPYNEWNMGKAARLQQITFLVSKRKFISTSRSQAMPY